MTYPATIKSGTKEEERYGRDFRPCAGAIEKCHEKVMQNIGKNNDSNALLDLGRRFCRSGNLKLALNVCQRLLSIDNQIAGAHHLLGLVALRSGNLEKALSSLLQALRFEPQSFQFNCDYAKALGRSSHMKEARVYLEKAIDLNPKSARAYLDLGIICHQLGMFGLAMDCYRDSLKKDPGVSDAYNNMGLIHQQRNELEKARLSFERVIAAGQNRSVVPIMNLGNIHKALGNFEEAIGNYRKALGIDSRIITAYLNIGHIYQIKKENRKALTWYERAYELAPENVEVNNATGAAYHDLENYAKAMRFYESAIKLAPELPQGYFNAGNIQRELGRPERAISFYRKAIDVDPEYQPALIQLINQLYRQFAWEEIRRLERTLFRLTHKALSQNKKPFETPFMNICRHSDPRINHKVALAWSSELEVPKHEILPIRKKTNKRGKKIKIGYLSGNFRNHPTSYLIAELLRQHDRKNFSIVCYSYGKNDGSAQRKEIQANCDLFQDISKVDDPAAARMIYEDEVDILIDLAGYTQGSRLKICAFRPAPVQVRYLGQPGTTGASFFDYIIADSVVTPPDHARYYSERFIFMPDCYQVNNHQVLEFSRIQIEKTKNPDAPFVFCCFCSVYKIEPTVFEAWMEILKAVPESVLWLMDESAEFVRNIRNAAKHSGVHPNRILFNRKLHYEEHMQRLAMADLALDTWIVNGAATTSDALWAGVPVVALKGRHFASRMSSSLLNAINMPGLLSDTIHDYVSLAVEIGQSPTRAMALRKEILEKRMREPLFDTARFVGNFERAVFTIWDLKKAGKIPRHITIRKPLATTGKTLS